MKIIGNSIARDNPIFSTQRISVSCKNNCWPPTSWLRQRSAPEQATGKWNVSENVRNKKNREWDRGTSSVWGREKQNPFAHTCMCTATHEGYSASAPPQSISCSPHCQPRLFASPPTLPSATTMFNWWLARNQKWQKNIPACYRSPGRNLRVIFRSQ